MADRLSVKAWRVAPWPPPAWLETAIKLVVIGIGIVALAQALSSGAFGLPGGARLVQLIILAMLSLGLVAALAGVPGPGWMLPAFAAPMLAGDSVKLVFIKVYSFTQRDLPRAALYRLPSVYAVGYLAILLLELVR